MSWCVYVSACTHVLVCEWTYTCGCGMHLCGCPVKHVWLCVYPHIHVCPGIAGYIHVRSIPCAQWYIYIGVSMDREHVCIVHVWREPKSMRENVLVPTCIAYMYTCVAACAFGFMCVCIFTHVHACMLAYLHMCVYLWTSCMYVCLRERTCIYVHLLVAMCVCLYLRVPTGLCVNAPWFMSCGKLTYVRACVYN